MSLFDPKKSSRREKFQYHFHLALFISHPRSEEFAVPFHCWIRRFTVLSYSSTGIHFVRSSRVRCIPYLNGVLIFTSPSVILVGLCYSFGAISRQVHGRRTGFKFFFFFFGAEAEVWKWKEWEKKKNLLLQITSCYVGWYMNLT